MNLPIVTQQRRKPIIFSLRDDKLNRFISTIDLDNHLRILAGMLEDFVPLFPFSTFMLDWPPSKMYLKGAAKDSPLKTLYDVLQGHLSESGYPVTVLSTMVVLHHEPFDTTLIEASSTARVCSLH